MVFVQNRKMLAKTDISRLGSKGEYLLQSVVFFLCNLRCVLCDFAGDVSHFCPEKMSELYKVLNSSLRFGNLQVKTVSNKF